MSIERESISNLEVEISSSGSIILKSLVTQLKQKGYYLNGASLAYYSPQYEIYITCANDPVPSEALLPPEGCEQLPSNLIIRIKLKELEEEQEIQQEKEIDVKGKKRPKERRISFVISKVLEWRTLYDGIMDGNGESVRYSLEEAAEKVGISKKSLDDYMLQLKLGKRYGFDFQKNKDKNVGVLRTFIKDCRRGEEKPAPKPKKNEDKKINRITAPKKKPVKVKKEKK